jgi:hypothetical protein
MSCTTQTRNLGIRNILLGKDTYQAGCITAVADVASSLDEKYFVMHEPVTQVKHYFWLSIGGSGTDPAVPNATGHEITIAANDTATTVATAIATAVGGESWVNATSSGAHVTITYSTYGYAYEMRDAIATAGKTGFTFSTSTFGSTQTDLGATEGDITLTLEEQYVDLTTPQTGTFITGQLRQGVGATVSFALQDTSVAKVRQAMNFYGSTVVPDNGSGAVLTGYGTSNLFKSTEDVATQLVLRPSSLASIPDRSQDFTFPKAKLALGELTMSAENVFVLPIEATAYLDASDNSFMNFFSYGDKTNL